LKQREIRFNLICKKKGELEESRKKRESVEYSHL